jgi:hypothetical protein
MFDKAQYPTDYPTDGLKITDSHTCATCGHEFGPNEHERLYAMYQRGSMLASLSGADHCPECETQLIKWA